MLYDPSESSVKVSYLPYPSECSKNKKIKKASDSEEYILKLKLVGYGSPFPFHLFSFNLRFDEIITSGLLLRCSWHDRSLAFRELL